MNKNKTMVINLDNEWRTVLKNEFKKPYFLQLMDFLKTEYSQNVCFPPWNEVFNAFNHTPFSQVKIVIIGQDPYHGYGQSHGLCFSVRKGVPLPPSLKNIFTEIKSDTNSEIPTHGDLTRWAAQGVLLLNATMSVQAHKPGSHHKKGWEFFTDAVIQNLSLKKEGLVFMLWGGPAKKKGAVVDKSKHLVLTSGHPSPLAANRGYWFGNKHFSKANEYLMGKGLNPIKW